MYMNTINMYSVDIFALLIEYKILTIFITVSETRPVLRHFPKKIKYSLIHTCSIDFCIMHIHIQSIKSHGHFNVLLWTQFNLIDLHVIFCVTKNDGWLSKKSLFF